MRSPGRPPVGRDVRHRVFWSAVARGVRSTEAGVEAGVSPVVGTRWFRECGGVLPQSVFAVESGRYLSFDEREQIALLRAEKVGVRGIAGQLGRAASTVSRALRRNASTRGGILTSRVTVAQWHRDQRATRPKTAKLVTSARLRSYVQQRLSGRLMTENWSVVEGPRVPFTGRNRARRADRRWGQAWSPEQISARLRLDYPDDTTMRISPEAIYQGLYIQGRGVLEREHVACLRTGRALRVPRARTRRGLRNYRGFITPDVTLDRRPTEVEDRAVAGHWEGDLVRHEALCFRAEVKDLRRCAVAAA